MSGWPVESPSADAKHPNGAAESPSAKTKHPNGAAESPSAEAQQTRRPSPPSKRVGIFEHRKALCNGESPDTLDPASEQATIVDELEIEVLMLEKRRAASSEGACETVVIRKEIVDGRTLLHLEGDFPDTYRSPKKVFYKCLAPDSDSASQKGNKFMGNCEVVVRSGKAILTTRCGIEGEISEGDRICVASPFGSDDLMLTKDMLECTRTRPKFMTTDFEDGLFYEDVGMTPITPTLPVGIQLNSEQETAYMAASQPGWHCIVGAPGTGKTTVVVQLVKQFFDEDFKILVVASANATLLALFTKLRAVLGDTFQPSQAEYYGSPRVDELADVPSEWKAKLKAWADKTGSTKQAFWIPKGVRIVFATAGSISCGVHLAAAISWHFKGVRAVTVMEEATQTPFAVSLGFVGLASIRKHVIFVGDPYQLGAYSTSSDDAYALVDDESSVMHYALRPREHSDGGFFRYTSHCSVQVHVHFVMRSHRLHPLMCLHAKKYLYKMDRRNVPPLHSAKHDEASPSAMVEIRVCDVQAEPDNCFEGGSRWNPFEVTAAMKCVEELVSSGTRLDDIAIVTPYSAMVNRTLQEVHKLGFSGLEVQTAGSFNGQERQYVIVPFVGGDGFLGSEKLVNSLTTRASQKLFAIVSSSYYNLYASHALGRWLDVYRGFSGVLNWFKYLPVDTEGVARRQQQDQEPVNEEEISPPVQPSARMEDPYLRLPGFADPFASSREQTEDTSTSVVEKINELIRPIIDESTHCNMIPDSLHDESVSLSADSPDGPVPACAPATLESQCPSATTELPRPPLRQPPVLSDRVEVGIDIYQDVKPVYTRYHPCYLGVGLVRLKYRVKGSSTWQCERDFIRSAVVLVPEQSVTIGDDSFCGATSQSLLLHQIARVATNLIPYKAYIQSERYAMAIKPDIQVNLFKCTIEDSDCELENQILNSLVDVCDSTQTTISVSSACGGILPAECRSNLDKLRRDMEVRVALNQSFFERVFVQCPSAVENYSMIWANHECAGGICRVGRSRVLMGLMEAITHGEKSLGQSMFMRQAGGNEFGIQSAKQFAHTHESVKSMCLIAAFILARLGDTREVRIANGAVWDVIGKIVSGSKEFNKLNGDHFHALEWMVLSAALIRATDQEGILPSVGMVRKDSDAQLAVIYIKSVLQYLAKFMCSRAVEPISKPFGTMCKARSPALENGRYAKEMQLMDTALQAAKTYRYSRQENGDEDQWDELCKHLLSFYAVGPSALDKFYGFSNAHRTVFFQVQGKKQVDQLMDIMRPSRKWIRAVYAQIIDPASIPSKYRDKETYSKPVCTRIVAEIASSYLYETVEGIVRAGANRHSSAEYFLPGGVIVQCRLHQLLEVTGTSRVVTGTTVGYKRVLQGSRGEYADWIAKQEKFMPAELIGRVGCKCVKLELVTGADGTK